MSADFADRLGRIIWRRPAPDIAERTRRRVIVHIAPWLFFLYILAFLDRVNVAVAGLDMKRPLEEGGLGFNEKIFAFGFGLFFWGYWILEIPSTISVIHWGARWVFVRILILWGISSTLVGLIGTPWMERLFQWLPSLPESELPLWSSVVHFVNEAPGSAEYQFYILRFLLGFFEGGFFPAVIMYLSLWFRPADRARAIATFMAAIPLSQIIGNPLSAWILGNIQWFGLQGWRWVLILEGVAPIIAGVFTILLMTDFPHKAKWLPEDERRWLESELDLERKTKMAAHGAAAWLPQIGTVLLLTGFYLCMNITSYGLNAFMPAIIKAQLRTTSDVAAYVGTLPYVLAMIAMLLNGWHSDRTKERIWHVAIPLVLLSMGIWLTAMFNGPGIVPVLLLIFAVGPFVFAHLPAFWPLPTVFLGAVAAASAIGFINMIGNLGGAIGPKIVGEAASAGTSEPDYTSALYKLIPWPLLAAAIIVGVGFTRRRALRAPQLGRTP